MTSWRSTSSVVGDRFASLLAVAAGTALLAAAADQFVIGAACVAVLKRVPPLPCCFPSVESRVVRCGGYPISTNFSNTNSCFR